MLILCSFMICFSMALILCLKNLASWPYPSISSACRFFNSLYLFLERRRWLSKAFPEWLAISEWSFSTFSSISFASMIRSSISLSCFWNSLLVWFNSAFSLLLMPWDSSIIVSRASSRIYLYPLQIYNFFFCATVILTVVAVHNRSKTCRHIYLQNWSVTRCFL